MLSKLKKSNNKGFTIIEVMIVLAIAGLILLIVFLAVPALKRNANNTTRKSDAAAISGAISEYTDNNSGTGPNTQATLTTAMGNAKLSSYTTAEVFYQGTETSAPTNVSAASSTGSATVLTTGDVIVVANATCNGNLAQAASSRDYVILYALEASSGSGTEQCTQA